MRWAPQQPLTCLKGHHMQAIGRSQGIILPFRSSVGQQLLHALHAAGDWLLSSIRMSQQAASSRTHPCSVPVSCVPHLLQITTGSRESAQGSPSHLRQMPFPSCGLPCAVSGMPTCCRWWRPQRAGGGANRGAEEPPQADAVSI